ncbi:response regulator transcription factor [Herpetosiphon sp. NSE202]|uniref:response regulator transcription factor n=1 Tax=Herpetosiphon sp. NSE202 TaxID=3351349 RepID=UPI00363EFA94
MAEHVPTILVIEDAVDLADVLVRELNNLGYRVWHAADGRTGLNLHQQHQPDLVILDWMLPQLDGLEVLRTIRQTKSTPVLMLTARSEETDLVVGLELGADDYLTKPFGMRELIARVRALLRRDQRIQQLLHADVQPATEVLRYGELVLDPHLHTVALRQQELDLTPTEFAILDLLLRNPGRAFSRNYLLDTIWGQSYVGGDRSVDNAMLRLRKKLADFGDAIETVWGLGYRLQAEAPR